MNYELFFGQNVDKSIRIKYFPSESYHARNYSQERASSTSCDST